MPLEDQIASLTTAINNLAAALAGKVPTTATPEVMTTKPKKEKPAPAAAPEVPATVEVTEEMMMQAGQRILDKQMKPKIVELNKRFGIERGRELLKGDDKAKLADYYTQLLAIADAA